MKELKDLVRRNVLEMKPYSSARDEYHGTASVFLDANENPYDTIFNRYPDPMQWQLKDCIASLKGVNRSSIFLGNGSDEPIDLIMRAFCDPAKDNIVSIIPSYGMYEVAANVNGVSFRMVKLTESFDVDVDAVLDAVDERTKVIFLCSPNNPTGNLLDAKRIIRIVEAFDGLIVLDEAYIDFANQPSFLSVLDKYPNLIILQTLSKAWGAAGIRLGMAFASPAIITILNKIKYSYNISEPTQACALDILDKEDVMGEHLKIILSEREHLRECLKSFPFVNKIYPSDANFLLVNVGDANALHNYLMEREVIVRNRTNMPMCEGCLRISVGTPEENKLLITALNNYRK